MSHNPVIQSNPDFNVTWTGIFHKCFVNYLFVLVAGKKKKLTFLSKEYFLDPRGRKKNLFRVVIVRYSNSLLHYSEEHNWIKKNYFHLYVYWHEWSEPVSSPPPWTFTGRVINGCFHLLSSASPLPPNTFFCFSNYAGVNILQRLPMSSCLYLIRKHSQSYFLMRALDLQWQYTKVYGTRLRKGWWVTYLFGGLGLWLMTSKILEIIGRVSKHR